MSLQGYAVSKKRHTAPTPRVRSLWRGTRQANAAGNHARWPPARFSQAVPRTTLCSLNQTDYRQLNRTHDIFFCIDEPRRRGPFTFVGLLCTRVTHAGFSCQMVSSGCLLKGPGSPYRLGSIISTDRLLSASSDKTVVTFARKPASHTGQHGRLENYVFFFFSLFVCIYLSALCMFGCWNSIFFVVFLSTQKVGHRDQGVDVLIVSHLVGRLTPIRLCFVASEKRKRILHFVRMQSVCTNWCLFVSVC